MPRADYLMTIAFWTSVPLYAVALAVFWPHLGWPGVFLWAVVVTSSAFLTLRAFGPVPGEEERSEGRWTSESVAYPVTLLLATSFVGFQVFPF